MKKKELLRLVRLIKKKLSLINKYLKQQQELPEEVKNAMSNIFDIFKEIEPDTEIEPDNDIPNKREVYQSIAKFIQENLHQPLPVCLRITHNLCREFDERLLKEGGEINQKLLEASKALILTIKVHYEPKVNYEPELPTVQTYNRQTVIYYIKENKPIVTRIEQELKRDSLPEDVRSEWLRKGEKKISFQLYPKE